MQRDNKKDYSKIFSDSESPRALKFANELWGKIIDDELFSRQKNDICDYVLYLFNKYDSAHFLDSLSNAENERLLKTTASKIKASKKNISVKFMNEAEYDEVFDDFLNDLDKRVKSNNLIIENGKIKTTIENPALRDILSSKLKVITNDALDYSLNSEKVSISIKNFLAMLRNEVAKENQAKYDAMIDRLKDKYKKEKAKDIFGAILGGAGNISSIISLIK